MQQNTKEPRWVPALSLKHSDIDIQVGDRIRIYNTETTVEGFHGSYNEGLERWETIIMTTKRGDPFERSLDVIEVDENKEYRNPYTESKPCTVIEGKTANEQMAADMPEYLRDGRDKGRFSWELGYKAGYAASHPAPSLIVGEREERKYPIGGYAPGKAMPDAPKEQALPEGVDEADYYAISKLNDWHVKQLRECQTELRAANVRIKELQEWHDSHL